MKIKRKVWKHKGTNQKMVTIPKDCQIFAGDDVLIELAPPEVNQEG